MEANSESAAPIPPAQQSNVAVGTDDGGRKRKPEQSTEPEQQQQHQQEQGGDGDARDGGGGRGSRGAKKRDMGRKAWGLVSWSIPGERTVVSAANNDWC